MQLCEILSEIEVGLRTSGEESEKMNKLLGKVKKILTDLGSVVEIRRDDNNLNDLDGSDVFLQGSYALDTAIKHDNYDVDVDLALIISSTDDLNVRNRVFNTLYLCLDKSCTIDLKKPCITIDYGNGYKIDIAIYTIDGDTFYHHNSINGYECKTESRPKKAISELRTYLKGNDIRKILRLSKHFIKTTTEVLKIKDCNKIPSISLLLYAYEENYPSLLIENESKLRIELLTFLRKIKIYVEQNQENGPSSDELLIGNTFYKVESHQDILNVLSYVIDTIERGNYERIVETQIYQKISNSKVAHITPAFVGTLG